MATIDSITTSITEMSQAQLHTHIHAIRANRRVLPTKAQRKKTASVAKVKRAPKKGKLNQESIFQFAKGLTDEQKAALALDLLKEMK